MRVLEDCLNGRRTVWEDPFKPGRKGIDGLAQRIEAHSPLALVILMLGTNDFQSMHPHNAWHSAQGVAALVNAIRQAPIEPGMVLVRVRRTAAGRVELTFRRGSQTVVRAHDAVVLTVPFPVLREVELDASLELPAGKQRAIAELRYGTNAKLNVGFNGRFWGSLGGTGETYSDLPHHQSTWEPNPSRATARNAVLLDYSGGNRGASMNPADPQGEAELWLGDLERIYPGASGAATRLPGGLLRAHLQHWPSDPWSRGSYTANHPGYFTTIAGLEAPPVGNLFFAGEHTDSFYEWQGFMEGAANSGLRAAQEILRA